MSYSIPCVFVVFIITCSALCLIFFFLMILRPPRSTLFPYNDALPICVLFRVFLELSVDEYITDNPQTGVNTDTTKLRVRSEEHTSELQSHSDLVCRLLLEKKKKKKKQLQQRSRTQLTNKPKTFTMRQT